MRVGSNRQDLLAHEGGGPASPLRHARQSLRRGEREIPAEHGHRADELALVGPERIEPGAQQRNEARRNVELTELAGKHQRPVALDEDPRSASARTVSIAYRERPRRAR